MSAQGPAVVIVGAGLMGRWHAHAARRVGGTVRAVVDSDAARATDLAAVYRAAPATTLTTALTAGADVVHICTPLSTHAALATLAVEAGCHVLVEKPLVPDLAVAEGLLALAARRGRLLCPVHQFLFQHGIQRALARRGEYGPVRYLAIHVRSAGAEGRSGAADDIAVEILPHVLALAARFAEEPIDKGTWQLMHPAAGELAVSGSVGTLGVNGLISMAGRPPVNEVRIVGERGAVIADLFHGFAVFERGEVSRRAKVLRPLVTSLATGGAAAANLVRRALRGESAYPGLRELVRRFYAATRGAAPNPIPPEETLAVARVWDRLRAAMPRT